MSEIEKQRERLLLGMDTSGSEGSLAIGHMDEDGSVTLVQQTILAGRHYADELIPQLKSLFAQTGVTLANLSVIVVVNGPGSFTGLRAGISAAKALAEAGNVPLLAVSRLSLLADTNLTVGAPCLRSSGGPAKQPFVPTIAAVAVLDAGRGEYYIRLPGGEESVASGAELTSAAGSIAIRACEMKVREQLAHLQVELLPPPTALDAIVHAGPRFLAVSFDDAATLDANYVRRPYANFAGPV